MHKRSSWIFILFAISIIAGVVSCLIFWPKNDNKSMDKPNEIIKDDDTKDDGSGDSKDEDEIYATSLVVNLPDSINILVGMEVKLLSGYLQIQPTEMLTSVIIEIITQNQSPSNGLKFENELLKADIVGNYKIKFSVAKSATQNLTKTIKVSVHDDNSLCHVDQKQDFIIKSNTTDISDLLNFNITNFQIVCDENSTFNNGKLTCSKIGNSQITVLFVENYMQYIYKFNFKVKDQPQYTIILTNVANNAIEINLSSSPTKFIYFQVKNRDEEVVDQYVVTKIADETIAAVESITDLYIKIKAKRVGTTSLTIISDADDTCFITIQIVVN